MEEAKTPEIKAKIRVPYTLHVFGIPHTATTIAYSACAFTMKVRKFLIMFMQENEDSPYIWHVVHYGNQDIDVPCSEHVPITSRETLQRVYGDRWKTQQFTYDVNDPAYQEFYRNGTIELAKRLKPGDIVLAFWGSGIRHITDHFDRQNMILVEPGIGYPISNIYSDYRVFESHAYLNYFLGNMPNPHAKDELGNYRQGTPTHGILPSWQDAVIENYFDPSEFEYAPAKKKGYFLFIGRLNADKGLVLYLQLQQLLGFRLIIGGQGSLDAALQALNWHGTGLPPGVEFVGYCDSEKRKKLMCEASVFLYTSFYLEPFGGGAVEAQFSGCPVIVSDNGAFPETVLDGVTGFRIKSWSHAVWSCRNIMRLIDAADCRCWAMANYSMQRIRLKFEEYFAMIRDRHLHFSGFYKRDDDRKPVTWLRKFYPPNAIAPARYLVPSARDITPVFPPLVPLMPPPLPPSNSTTVSEPVNTNALPVPIAKTETTSEEGKVMRAEIERLAKMIQQSAKVTKTELPQKAAMPTATTTTNQDVGNKSITFLWPTNEQGKFENTFPVTVVTALYDIGRGQHGDGRSFEQYMAWFAQMLALNVPLVVYVDAKQVDFVKQHRGAMPTHLIVTPFHRAPCFDRLAKMDKVLKDPGFRSTIKATNNIEWKMPAYHVVIWSKFLWMQHAGQRNVFGSKVFLWLDAAVNRFFGQQMDPRQPWPHGSWLAPSGKCKQLKKYLNNNKIWIEGRQEAEAIHKGQRVFDESKAVGSCECILPAGCFGGTKQAVDALTERMMKLLDNEWLSNMKIDNEQVGMAIDWRRNPVLFNVVMRSPTSKTWLEIVTTLAQPRKNDVKLLL